MDELRRVAGALVAGVLVGALFWPVSCITAVSAVVGMSSDGADSETRRSEGAVPRAPDELQGLPQRSTSCWGLIVPLAHYTSASSSARAELQGQGRALAIGIATSLATYLLLRVTRKGGHRVDRDGAQLK